MSRDGWLPPGVTDADIDRATWGHEMTENTLTIQEMSEVVGEATAEIFALRCDVGRLRLAAVNAQHVLSKIGSDEATEACAVLEAAILASKRLI